MQEMDLLGPFFIQSCTLMQWAGLETPKGVTVRQRVKPSLPSPAWAEGIVVCSCVCVCVCVSVLPQKCCLNSIISKSKQVAAIKLGNPVQKVDLYKMSRFLQANAAQIASKFENKKTNRTSLTRKTFESS